MGAAPRRTRRGRGLSSHPLSPLPCAACRCGRRCDASRRLHAAAAPGAGRTREPSSSARKMEGASVSARATTWVRARVRATWKTRRSPSSSLASRCGKRPLETSKTRTWSHSRPLMRWMVESRTRGPSAGVRVNTSRSQRSNVATSGWSAATDSSAARSSVWVERSASLREESRTSMVSPSPMPTRMALSAAAEEVRQPRTTVSRSPA